MKRKVAVFDIDGTIFRSSLLIELVETLISKGSFEKNVSTSYKKEKNDWLNRQGSYENYIEALTEVYMKNIKGLSYNEFNLAVDEVIKIHKGRVYRYTRDLIKKLKSKKYFLLAVSQSPKIILDPFCKNLGFDKIYGRFYEIGPTDRLTGIVTDEHLIRHKANILRRVVAKENLTLKNSIGVGDTEGDISFLEMVEEPICFNPNASLFMVARRNGWKVVIERKDVVYQIQ